MKKIHLILGLVVLVVLAALLIWGWNRSHFDFGLFRSQLAMADWRKIGIAIGCVYFAYLIPALILFFSPPRPVPVARGAHQLSKT